MAQDYRGPIQIVVVFDRAAPDDSLAGGEPGEPSRWSKTAALPAWPGLRNTGVLQLDTELVAFCDDDDTWCPGKLSQQVDVLREDPATQFVTTAMQVEHADGGTAIRLAGKSTITFDDLIRSRMSMLHSSSFVFRARRRPAAGWLRPGRRDDATKHGRGLGSAAARSSPRTDTACGRTTGASAVGRVLHFSEVWSDKIAANHWLVAHYPELHRDRRTSAMMSGKLAFGHAALGHRRESLQYIAPDVAHPLARAAGGASAACTGGRAVALCGHSAQQARPQHLTSRGVGHIVHPLRRARGVFGLRCESGTC